MIHLFLIDPLQQLKVHKDSSLLLAATLKRLGETVYLLFANDLFYRSQTHSYYLTTFDFEASYTEPLQLVDQLKVTQEKKIVLDASVTIHMRLDPPFDMHYLQTLWQLQAIEREYQVRVINAPTGILSFQEKLYAYGHATSIPSFVGASAQAAWDFAKNYEEVVVKPVELFQGIGVEKCKIESESSFCQFFQKKLESGFQALIVQPFLPEIVRGEVRAIYFKEQLLASILKTPRPGEFISNIAAGADFESYQLNEEQRAICQQVASDLSLVGVDWIAFDLIGDRLSEVNITCPGLLVEGTKAAKKNLAEEIVHLLS